MLPSARSLIVLLLTTLSIVHADPICTDVTIPVNISATNVKPPAALDFASIQSFVALSLGQITNLPIKGSYNIFARYCEPEVHVGEHSQQLHLLVHGYQRDHHYWNGYDATGEPYHGANYSWVERASQQGYPTLAIDRLGNGLSDRADPVLVAQVPANAEVLHAIIKHVKAGGLGVSYSNIVYVGHSYGSVIGQVLMAKYPSDVRRAILTGWAPITPRLLLAASSANTSAPAAEVEPVKYGNLPAGYLLSTNPDYDAAQTYYGAGTSFAGKYYDTAIPALGYSTRGTGTTGELLSFISILTLAPQFKGRVLVVTAEHDAFLCGNTSSANCGSGESSVPAKGRSIFPNATSYDYYIPADTGHEWDKHYSQDKSFGTIFEWLEKSP